MASSVTKSIFAVSLDSEQKHRATAILFDGARLVITHCMPITGSPEVWRPRLKEEIAEKAAHGFAVIVEDRADQYTPSGNPFSFEDVEDGRTFLQLTLEWWFSLKNSGNLVLDESVTRYDMRAEVENALINISTDEMGRIRYVPDWKRFHGGHKALLLCVAAAMMEDPYSDHYVEAMRGGFPSPPAGQKGIIERLCAVFQARDTARQEELEFHRSARGKR